MNHYQLPQDPMLSQLSKNELNGILHILAMTRKLDSAFEVVPATEHDTQHLDREAATRKVPVPDRTVSRDLVVTNVAAALQVPHYPLGFIRLYENEAGVTVAAWSLVYDIPW